MPRGPKGQKRPADVVGNAVHVMRVLTGEIVEEGSPVRPSRADLPPSGGTAPPRNYRGDRVDVSRHGGMGTTS
jgi:hypothetical protein